MHAKALACAGPLVEARDALTDAERQLDRPRFAAYAGACYLRIARLVEADGPYAKRWTRCP